MAGEAIFVGYRRDDTADVAGRIYDAMAQRFGRQRLFKDVDNIAPGVDFGDYINTVLPRCRVALILIGPHWLESRDESGRRRLDDEHDWVRVEIETALATPGLLVAPVLINGAQMPRSEDVPESLRPLLRRNAASIRRDPDFHDDVERLASAIRSSVNTGIIDFSKIGARTGASPSRPSRERTNARLLVAGAAVLALAATGVGASRWLASSHRQTPGAQTNAAATEDGPPASGREAAQQAGASETRRAPAGASNTQARSAGPIVGPARGSIEEWTRTIGEGRIYFGADSTSLDAAALQALDEQAAWLIANPNVLVRIEAHAPPEGLTTSARYLSGVSERRAQAVADALVSRGVLPERITTLGFGANRLPDPGPSPEAIARSRSAQVIPYLASQ